MRSDIEERRNYGPDLVRAPCPARRAAPGHPDARASERDGNSGVPARDPPALVQREVAAARSDTGRAQIRAACLNPRGRSSQKGPEGGPTRARPSTRRSRLVGADAPRVRL